MNEEQENMVKSKLAEIADAIPECRGAVFAISTGGTELTNLFTHIAAQVAIALAMETTPEKAVGIIRRYGDAAPLVLTYGFLTAVRDGLSKCLGDAAKEKLDKELEEAIGGGN